MIVKGHGLLREGTAHDAAGNYLGNSRYAGYGFCQCGARTPKLGASNAARKRWHREHKAAVFSQTLHQ
jgi:hypothetical protein